MRSKKSTTCKSDSEDIRIYIDGILKLIDENI